MVIETSNIPSSDQNLIAQAIECMGQERHLEAARLLRQVHDLSLLSVEQKRILTLADEIESAENDFQSEVWKK